MRAAIWKGTSELVAPHDLSSKFLLGMRGKDRPLALAFLDQQTILRPLLRAILAPASTATSNSSNRFAGRGSFARTRNQAAAATTSDRAPGQHTGDAEFSDRLGASNSRRRLHLRRANQERNALLATRSWTSALLATQGSAGDAARRQVACK